MACIFKRVVTVHALRRRASREGRRRLALFSSSVRWLAIACTDATGTSGHRAVAGPAGMQCDQTRGTCGMFDMNGFVTQSQSVGEPSNHSTVLRCIHQAVCKAAWRRAERTRLLGAVLSLSLSNRSSHRGRDVPTATTSRLGSLNSDSTLPTLGLTDLLSSFVTAQPASSAMHSVGRRDVTFDPFS